MCGQCGRVLGSQEPPEWGQERGELTQDLGEGRSHQMGWSGHLDILKASLCRLDIPWSGPGCLRGVSSSHLGRGQARPWARVLEGDTWEQWWVLGRGIS